MYEVSPLDHLATKVDALSKKFDKMNISVVTHAPGLPPCEFYGVFVGVSPNSQSILIWFGFVS